MRRYPMHKKWPTRRRQKGVAETSQFAVVTYILFLIILIPLLNLGWLFMAAATQYLTTNDLVSKASTQANFSKALNTVVSEASYFQTFGLAKLIGMLPQGGYIGCGDDLYVLSTNVASGAVTKSPANMTLSQQIDTGSNVYELSVKSSYSISPPLKLSSVPILKDVPGVGKPVIFTFVANRPVEHPGGLQQSALNTGHSSSNRVTAFNAVRSSLTAGSSNSGTWNNPQIFAQIKQAGETIVSENVFIVQANNPNWTSAGVKLAPGQTLWIDTQAVGTWSASSSTPLYGASGIPYTAKTGSPGNSLAPNLDDLALIARVGTGGQPFFVGSDLTNYPTTGTGLISMIMNDEPGYFGDNTGAQEVRIIITQ